MAHTIPASSSASGEVQSRARLPCGGCRAHPQPCRSTGYEHRHSGRMESGLEARVRAPGICRRRPARFVSVRALACRPHAIAGNGPGFRDLCEVGRCRPVCPVLPASVGARCCRAGALAACNPPVCVSLCVGTRDSLREQSRCCGRRAAAAPWAEGRTSPAGCARPAPWRGGVFTTGARESPSASSSLR